MPNIQIFLLIFFISFFLAVSFILAYFYFLNDWTITEKKVLHCRHAANKTKREDNSTRKSAHSRNTISRLSKPALYVGVSGTADPDKHCSLLSALKCFMTMHARRVLIGLCGTMLISLEHLSRVDKSLRCLEFHREIYRKTLETRSAS